MKKYLFLTSILLTGCASMGITEQKTVEIDKSDESKNVLEIASFPTQLRGAYVYTGDDGKKYVCAEPFADVAASSSLNATANAINNLSTTLNKSLEASRAGENSSSANLENTSSSQLGDDNTSNTANSSTTDSNSLQRNLGTTYGTNAQNEQSINVGLNTVNQIVALEGRTQFVLLAREMLFRTCEASANGKLESADSAVAKQHALVFNALAKMLDTQKVEAETEKAKAEAEKAKAVVAAAEKLDPKILKVFANNSLNKTILDQYLEEYTSCITDSGDDQGKKDKCKRSYNQKVTKLSGD